MKALSSTASALESAVSQPGVSSQEVSTAVQESLTYPRAHRPQAGDVGITVATTHEENPAPARQIKSLYSYKLSDVISEAASDRSTVSTRLPDAVAGEPLMSMPTEDVEFELLDLENLADEAGDLCDLDPADSAFHGAGFEHFEHLEDEIQAFKNFGFDENSDFEGEGSEFKDSEFGDSWAEGSEGDEELPSDTPRENAGTEVSLLTTPAIRTPMAVAGQCPGRIWHPGTPVPFTPDGRIAWELLFSPEFVEQFYASSDREWVISACGEILRGGDEAREELVCTLLFLRV